MFSALPPETGHCRARPFRHCVVLRRKVRRNHHFCDLRHRRHRRRTPINQLWATIARRGFHASSVVQLRAYPCCLRGCLSCTADRAARGWRRCGSPGVVEQMGALVFRCPTTHEPFRSNFRATPEELKRISRAATMELRCEICKQRHVFVVTECTIDDTG